MSAESSLQEAVTQWECFVFATSLYAVKKQKTKEGAGRAAACCKYLVTFLEAKDSSRSLDLGFWK